MSPTARRIMMAGTLLASAGFARLGVWQLSRLHQRRAANAATLAARAAPPARLAPGSSGTDTLGEHFVVAQGHYDHGHEILLRGEVFDGAPGVEVVTPLLLAEGGPAVLVNRTRRRLCRHGRHPGAGTADRSGPGTAAGFVAGRAAGPRRSHYLEAARRRRAPPAAAISHPPHLHPANSRQRPAPVSQAARGTGGR
jgi:hypothetical protein